MRGGSFASGRTSRRVEPARRPDRCESPSHPIGTYPDPKGAIWGLTILIDFSDTAPAFTKAQVEAWLNQRGYREGGLNGSIRDYFFDNSNGVVNFQNQVVGFYRASQPKSYYEADTGYSRASALVNEAVAAIDAEVDFSMFDNDGDGRTEAVSIVYAGPQGNFGRGLWPHAGSINTTRDGVQVRRYQMTNMGTRLGLYVFAHEVGHMVFGWPDLYGFGNYCIMGNASSTTNPVGINDFYRADQGWIPVIDIAPSTNARYYAVPNTGGYRYVNPERPEEAFFWSNVQATNRWSTLSGSGIVLLHFDYEIRNNNPPNPLSLAVVQADGMRELDGEQWPMPGSDASDFYHSGTKTEFSATTTPSSAWNDRSASGLRIYEISANGPMMTFAVGSGTPGPGIGGGAGLGGMGGAGGMTKEDDGGMTMVEWAARSSRWRGRRHERRGRQRRGRGRRGCRFRECGRRRHDDRRNRPRRECRRFFARRDHERRRKRRDVRGRRRDRRRFASAGRRTRPHPRRQQTTAAAAAISLARAQRRRGAWSPWRSRPACFAGGAQRGRTRRTGSVARPKNLLPRVLKTHATDRCPSWACTPGSFRASGEKPRMSSGRRAPHERVVSMDRHRAGRERRSALCPRALVPLHLGARGIG